MTLTSCPTRADTAWLRSDYADDRFADDRFADATRNADLYAEARAHHDHHLNG